MKSLRQSTCQSTTGDKMADLAFASGQIRAYICDMMPEVELLHRMQGHSGAVHMLTAGLEPGQLLSASADQIVAGWDIKSGLSVPFSVQLESPAYSLIFIPELQQLFVGQGRGGIHVIDLTKRQEVQLVQAHQKPVFDLAWNSLEKHLYVAGGDGKLTVWETNPLKLKLTLTICAEKLREVKLSPDKKWLAVAAGDGTICIFETNFYNEIYRFNAHETGTNSLAWHPKKPWLLSGGKDAYLRFWAADADFKMLREIAAHNYAIYRIEFDPTGNYAATASRDKTVKIWEADSFDKPLRLQRGAKYAAHRYSVNALYWDANTGLLASSGDDRDILIWRVR